MSQSKSMIVFVVALVALCASLSRTASVGTLSEAMNLLNLINLANKRLPLTVANVVAAYEDYQNLYTMQNNLAADQKNSEGRSKYEKITEVLRTPGIESITENLFMPLYDSSPKHLSKSLRIKIQSAIDEMTRQNQAAS